MARDERRGPASVRSFRVGKRMVTMTLAKPVPGGTAHTVAEWAPNPLSRLTKREIKQYQAGRDAALRELAEQFGTRMAVIEL
jgi:hypothetical protein